MKKSFATTILILIMFCGNCQEKKAVLFLQDSIRIELNQPMPAFTLAMFYYEKGNEKYLYVDDRDKKLIRVIDFVSGKEIEPVPVNDKGFYAITLHNGFFVKCPDSIYLPGYAALYCINRKGEVLISTDLSNLSDRYPLFHRFSSISRYTKCAVFKGNDLYFLQDHGRKLYFEYHPSDYHFLLRYDMKKDSFFICPITMPDDCWSNGKTEMSLSMTYNDLQNNFVFSDLYSDKIYLSRDGNRIDKTYTSRSKSVYEFYRHDPSDTIHRETSFYPYCKYSRNVGLLWDPHNKIY